MKVFFFNTTAPEGFSLNTEDLLTSRFSIQPALEKHYQQLNDKTEILLNYELNPITNRLNYFFAMRVRNTPANLEKILKFERGEYESGFFEFE